VSTGPRVLFVSKAVVPPWNDGSKNLVRDLAANLTHARATVMTTPDADLLGPQVTNDHVYHAASRFSPALAENARVLSRLLQKDTHDAWAFVFAPNTRTSFVARGAILAARARGFRGKVVQIVASSPVTFRGVSRLLFGDVVVALSEFTRGRLFGAGVTRDVRVIPPCARPLRVPSLEEVCEVRARYNLGDGPIILYPGDYEVSTGAETMAAAVRQINAARPDARVLFACREKTPRSVEARAQIEAELTLAGLSGTTRHAGNVPDMAPLVHAADVVAFPVDDLYGKVDIPLVLLEAMAARKPIIVCRGGPLGMLSHAPSTEPGDAEALSQEIGRLLSDAKLAAHVGQLGEDLYHARFSPKVVAGAYDSLFAEICDRG
jgi:glycosyltransferase involved in cell wall biosynthesis